MKKTLIFFLIIMASSISIWIFKYESEKNVCQNSFYVINKAAKANEVIAELDLMDYAAIKTGSYSVDYQAFYLIGITSNKKAHIIAYSGHEKNLVKMGIDTSLANKLISEIDSIEQNFSDITRNLFTRHAITRCNFTRVERSGKMNEKIIFSSMFGYSSKSSGIFDKLAGYIQSDLEDFLYGLQKDVVKGLAYHPYLETEKKFYLENLIEVELENGVEYRSTGEVMRFINENSAEDRKSAVFYELGED